MKKVLVVCFPLLFSSIILLAQDSDSAISFREVHHFVSALADDSMQGRRIFTPGIEKAAAFIAKQFKRAGLKKWPGQRDYYQRFDMIAAHPVAIALKWNGEKLPEENLIEISTKRKIHWTEKSAVKLDSVTTREELRQKIRLFLHPEEDMVIWVNAKLKTTFSALSNFLSKQRNFQGTPTVVLVLADHQPKKFEIKIKNRLQKEKAANILGYLPGKTKPEEYVIFSAHYDHLGIDTSLEGDSLFNGANDDASGTTAVMALARYFAKKQNNARSLIFVAFTGEEAGGYGSTFFSEQVDPAKVVAMLNIEMIGTAAKWGENTAYITGFKKSDLGDILQKSLENTHFDFYPDPYPQQNLFYRSDNAMLARLGVPAHTISTAKMDNELHYHKVSDEVHTLDIKNMRQIILAIAQSATSLVEGVATPSRLNPKELQ